MRAALWPLWCLMFGLIHAVSAVLALRRGESPWADIGAASWAGVAAYQAAELFLLKSGATTPPKEGPTNG